MLYLDLSVSLGSFKLDVETQIPATGISALLGPSGCGKTTVLRCIAGFASCKGRIALGNNIWLDTTGRINLPAFQRPVGYVFQDARLFHHLNVAGNLKFASQRASANTTLAEKDVIDMLDLGPLLERATPQLSGGEIQRVAIARTLLRQPSLLLLDEPLSALDNHRKQELLPYLQRVCNELSIPAIFVSHAIDEVAALATHTLIMDQGHLLCEGPTEDMLRHPSMAGITAKSEAGAMLSGKVLGFDEKFQLAEVVCEGQSIFVPTPVAPSSATTARLFVREKDVALANQAPVATSVRNILRCRITQIEQQDNSPYAQVHLRMGGQHLTSQVTRAAVTDLMLQPDAEIYALVKAVSFG
ncbi:MAG: molybdenum ABC transporter ATP-binding protein [Pseudomonadaceae bacterium]|nr:molybdenum ABC transporter ATP-binding protein [Pseudomonadaceae bacterium]